YPTGAPNDTSAPLPRGRPSTSLMTSGADFPVRPLKFLSSIHQVLRTLSHKQLPARHDLSVDGDVHSSIFFCMIPLVYDHSPLSLANQHSQIPYRNAKNSTTTPSTTYIT